MTKAEFKKELNQSARRIRKALDIKREEVVINTELPTIAIGEFIGCFIQGQDAEELLAEVPDYIDPRNWLLWYLDSAGAL